MKFINGSYVFRPWRTSSGNKILGIVQKFARAHKFLQSSFKSTNIKLRISNTFHIYSCLLKRLSAYLNKAYISLHHISIALLCGWMLRSVKGNLRLSVIGRYLLSSLSRFASFSFMGHGYTCVCHLLVLAINRSDPGFTFACSDEMNSK